MLNAEQRRSRKTVDRESRLSRRWHDSFIIFGFYSLISFGSFLKTFLILCHFTTSKQASKQTSKQIMKILSKNLIISAATVLMAITPYSAAVDFPWTNDGTAKVITISSADQPFTFTWTGSHNVVQFPDKAAHDGCDFTSATVICAQVSGGSCVLTGLTEGTTYYYGCSVFSGNHCLNGNQKLALTVSKPSSAGGGLFSLCK